MIRLATLDDVAAIAAIFHDTVKAVNSHDYSAGQINAWAGNSPEPEKWRARQTRRRTFVFEKGDAIHGFAEFEPRGHIDAGYVHAEQQRKGVASALLARMEQEAEALGLGRLFTEASITARPFFVRHGFETLQEQVVEYRGCRFRNFKMAKRMPNTAPARGAGQP